MCRCWDCSLTHELQLLMAVLALGTAAWELREVGTGVGADWDSSLLAPRCYAAEWS